MPVTEGATLSTTEHTDSRLERIQDEIDAIRQRLPKNPGLDIPDPDTQPLLPADEDEDVFPGD